MGDCREDRFSYGIYEDHEMKLKAPLLVLALMVGLVAGVPATAQKVRIDYDPNYDASKVKTFAWTFTPRTSLAEESPFLHSRIVNAIAYQLTTANMRQVDTDADIQVTYHASASEELRLDTISWGYGYPAGPDAAGLGCHRVGTLGDETAPLPDVRFRVRLHVCQGCPGVSDRNKKAPNR
jgi:hypothetical protein